MEYQPIVSALDVCTDPLSTDDLFSIVSNFNQCMEMFHGSGAESLKSSAMAASRGRRGPPGQASRGPPKYGGGGQRRGVTAVVATTEVAVATAATTMEATATPVVVEAASMVAAAVTSTTMGRTTTTIGAPSTTTIGGAAMVCSKGTKSMKIHARYVKKLITLLRIVIGIMLKTISKERKLQLSQTAPMVYIQIGMLTPVPRITTLMSLRRSPWQRNIGGQDQVHNANGQGMEICHVGHSIVKTPHHDILLGNILHCPNTSKNLFSIHRIAIDNKVFL